MSRGRTLARCVMHNKNTYRTYDLADSVSRDMPIPGRVYFCEFTGGYHLTSTSRAERDRQTADPVRPLSVNAIDTITNLASEYAQCSDHRLARRLAGSVPGLLRHIQYLTQNGVSE